jgi:hypothetical protein
MWPDRHDFSLTRWQRRMSYWHFRGREDLSLCATEHLVAALVHEFGEGRWRDGPVSPLLFDGLVPEYEKRQPDSYLIYGIQHLLGSEEPLMGKFYFNEATRRMTGGTVLFGMQDHPAVNTKFDLSGKLLALALGARHPLQFEWEYEFTLADGQWS